MDFRSPRISCADWITDFAILLQCLVDDAFQLGRNFWIQVPNRCGRVVQDGVVKNRRSFSRKCPSPHGHFVQNETEGKQVGPGIQLFATHLLGRHVTRGSDRHSRAAEGETGIPFLLWLLLTGAGWPDVRGLRTPAVWRGRSRRSWFAREL